MSFQLLDTHAHLVSDDWDHYRPMPFAPGMPIPERTEYTVTAEQLVAMMDANGVTVSCVVQRGHIYGYDNSYILDSAEKFPDRLHPVVILDPQDPETPGAYREMVQSGRACGFRMAQTRPWILDTAWMSSPSAMKVWEVCAEFRTPMDADRVQQPAFLRQSADQGDRAALSRAADHSRPRRDRLRHVAIRGRAEGRSRRDGGHAPPPDFGITGTVDLFEDVPNVNFKITEINMERLIKAEVRPADFIRRMADSFGADRLIWGSDVGQSMLWTYEQKVEMARSAAGPPERGGGVQVPSRQRRPDIRLRPCRTGCVAGVRVSVRPNRSQWAAIFYWPQPWLQIRLTGLEPVQ